MSITPTIDWRRCFDGCPDLLCVADFGGRFVALNPAWEERLGYPVGELEGRSYVDVVHPDDQATTAAEKARVVAGARTVAFENRLRHRDGTYRRLCWSAAPDPERGLVYAVAREPCDGAGRSEDERLEARLQAEKRAAVSRLAGGIAHDFNNLLTAIGGYAELLLAGLADAPGRADCEEILGACQRATELTRQLLLFARPQAFEPRLVDLNATVAASERMLRGLVGEQIELEVHLHPDLPPVLADPDKIEQVLVGLVASGRDAMGGRGRITVETALTASQEVAGAALRVSDTGPAIEPAVRDSIFEPFFAARATGRGTGLGLATVHAIVQQLGGSIGAGGGPGEGAQFEVLLPAPREPSAPR